MIPIITDSVEVERLSIYNAIVLRQNPLERRPLQEHDRQASAAGPDHRARRRRLCRRRAHRQCAAGPGALLSYGIDLDMTGRRHEEHRRRDSVRTAKIVKGVLILSRKLVSTQEYVADNKIDKDKTLVIEHPIRTGWKLVDTQKPFETTPALYRFKGTAVADKVTELTVKEEIVAGRSHRAAVGGPRSARDYSRRTGADSASRARRAGQGGPAQAGGRRRRARHRRAQQQRRPRSRRSRIGFART